MNLEVDFTGVEEATSSKFPDRLTPGVYDLITISGLELGTGTGDKKTPYAEFSFIADAGEHKDKFYLTVKALPRLKHMLLACGVSNEVLSARMSADQLKAVSIGKHFRGRLNGREYINKKGEKAIASEFGFSGFAEPVGGTTVTFDAVKHISYLPSGATGSLGEGEGFKLSPPKTGSDDLPF